MIAIYVFSNLRVQGITLAMINSGTWLSVSQLYFFSLGLIAIISKLACMVFFSHFPINDFSWDAPTWIVLKYNIHFLQLDICKDTSNQSHATYNSCTIELTV